MIRIIGVYFSKMTKALEPKDAQHLRTNVHKFFNL